LTNSDMPYQPVLRRDVLKSLGAALSFSPTPGPPPNILLILGDDVGWTDLACYGSRYHETPNLNRLRQQGMKFTEAYTNAAQCAPTRACLLTGRDVGRHGVWAVDRLRGLEKFRRMEPPPANTELPLTEITIAQALRSAGYATAMYGKWHLGEEGEYHPSRRGFDEAILTTTDPGRHFDFVTKPHVAHSPQEYLADFITNRAIAFVEAHRKTPFFLYLPHFAVHRPLQARESVIARYRNKPPDKRHSNAIYAAMLESIDTSVGRLMRSLDDLSLADNTVVIFYSDNGGVGGFEREGLTWGGRSPTDNYPLRGGKGMLYEGGTRVPLIVRWPGVIQPHSSCSKPVTSTDFFPTLLEAAGPKPLAIALDGVSLMPLLRSSGQAAFTRKPLYWHYPGYLQADAAKGTWRIEPSGAIRAGKYKLIERFEDGRLELYDLEADLGESHNLAARMPEKAQELRQTLVQWRRSTNAPMPARKS
jgi:arylsulfatase A-like enzyme